jgi:nicotinate-nucleotide adenylyltransferase
LGGSFNPPHNGHVGIAHYILSRSLADQVWVIPCADHPYGKKLATYDDRLAMCRLAFRGIPHVTVSDIESQLPRPSYTVQTIRHLIQDASQKFSLIVGSDIAGDLPRWKDGAEIKTLVGLLTVPRGPGSPIPDVSATAIRQCVSEGKSITDQVPGPVAQYIHTHHLYQTS